MLDYTLRRLAGTVPVLLGILTITFAVLYLVPGDPAAALAGPRASEADLARLRGQMGLDQPLPQRFVGYLGRILRGDLGESYVSDNAPVASLLWERMPYTLGLSLLAVVISTVLGLLAGAVAAMWRGGWCDRLVMVGSVLGISSPVFFSGLLLYWLLAIRWQLLPGSAGTVEADWRALILPALTLGLRSGAFLARVVRSSLVEVLQQDYIRTALAKGLSRWRILWRHALPNAMVPVITVVALDISSYLNGSVITESIFDVPGLGRFAMDAIAKRDYPSIQGIVLFGALVFTLINLGADLLYAWVNPKVRDQLGSGTAA